MSDAKPVRPKDWVCFQCNRCGNCCRDLEDQLMLEPLDAYNLAQCLRKRGKAESIDDVFTQYTHVDLLQGCLPIYLMNTDGPDHTCVLLKDGRCSVYEGRPHICRLYPFSVHTGTRGKDFAFYQCLDQHSAHFCGGRIQVKDWFYANFIKENREFMAIEANVLQKLGPLIRALDENTLRTSMFQILHYRYYNYGLDRPFLPQYKRNMEALEQFLQARLREV